VKTLSEARAHENYEKTRKFYLKSGFVPIEEFKTLWGEHNPCLMLIKDLGLTANHTAEESINKIHNFWNYFSEQKWNEAETLLHADFVATWPQSKERIVGPKNYINVNRNYPGKHKFKIIHSFPFANKVLMTAWIEADTRQKTFVNSIIEISEGKILNIEEYWAEPFSAPEWRKQWVEIY
ncbi:MAG: hypothetical protein H7235_01205, partial [Bdellovibrionaceae bacterium]|nr:hypothetical protein [Pseudobdellovibrionaceae bacterium]